jgi:hypothetical protein
MNKYRYFTSGIKSVLVVLAILLLNSSITFGAGVKYPKISDYILYSTYDAANPGNNIITDFYPGDEVTIVAAYTGMDDDGPIAITNAEVEALSFFLKLGTNYTIAVSGEDAQGNETDTDNNPDTLVFTVTIPNNIGDLHGINTNLKILTVNGTTINEGTGAIANDNLVTNADYFDEANLIGAPNYSVSSIIEFTGSGLRQYVTNPFAVGDAVNAELHIDVQRLSTGIPSAGTELYVEYSTNGSTWSKLDTIYLTGENEAGNGFFTQFSKLQTSGEIPSAIVSSTTQFRVRQAAENNLEDINSWAIRNFIFYAQGLNGNIKDEYTKFYDVLTPDFNIDLVTTGTIYPGETVDFEINSKNGTFPDDTYYEIYYTNGNNRIIKRLSSLGAGAIHPFSIDLPFDTGYKMLYVKAVYYDGSVSNWAGFTINTPLITIDEVSYDLIDGGTEYNIPNKTITVDYSLTGQVANNVADVHLQIYNEQMSEWETLTETPVTTAINNGDIVQISGIIPEYNYGTDADIQVVLMNKECSANIDCFSYTEYYLIGFDTDNDVNYYDFEINLTDKSKIGFDIYSHGDIDVNQPIEFVRYNSSTNTWITFASKDISAMSASESGYLINVVDLASFVDVPEASGSNDLIGIKHPNVADGTIELVKMRSLETKSVYTAGAANYGLNIIYPSISLADFNDVYNRDILYGETIELQYSTFEIPADVAKFAITLEQIEDDGDGNFGNDPYESASGQHVYTVIGESTSTGLVNIDVTFPTRAQLDELGFETDNDYQLRVRAYDDADDFPIITALSESFNIYDNNYIIEAKGNNGSSQFYQKDERYAITKAFDLSDVNEPVTLSFTYYANLDNINEYTLPHIQVSIDNGVTYHDLKAEDSEYADINRLDAFAWPAYYSIEIPTQYLTSNTHFRWIQDAVSGQSIDYWYIFNVNLSGFTNLIEDTQFEVNYLTGNGSMEYYGLELIDAVSGYSNLSAYRMTFPDFNYENLDNFDPVIKVDEEAKLSWTAPLNDDGEPIYGTIWPDTTEFEFIIVYNSNNDTIFINQEGENNAMLFTIPASLDIETDVYTWKVKAKLEYFDENGELAYHTYPTSGYANFTDLVIGGNFQTLIINETTPDALLLVAEDIDDMGTPTYYINDEITMQYAEYGNWASSIDLALVLEQRNLYGNVLDRTPLELVTNANNDSITATLPSAVVEDADLDYYTVGLYPYMGTNIEFGDNINLDFDTDFEALVGCDDDKGEFIDEGDRYAVTNTFDFSAYDSVLFTFEFEADVPENPATMVKLEVSIDGGATYVPFVIDNQDATFGANGFLPADYDDDIDLIIPKAFCTATTSFRFSQESNMGEDTDEWYIWDLMFIAGSNLFFDYTENNTIQEINFETPSVNNYAFELVKDANGYEPVLYSGATADFTFVIDSVMGEAKAKFPVGTVFDFYLADYPLSGDTTLIATGNGINYTFTLPTDILRDTYSINVKATFEGIVYDYATAYSLPVYNPVLITKVDNNNEVIFAGNTANFTGEWESDAIVPNPDWYYNLIMMADDFDGNNAMWLLATQQNSTSFADIVIPSFVRNAEFIIAPTLNEAIGVVGEELSANADLMGSQDLNNSDFTDEDYQWDGISEWAYRMSNTVGAEELLTTNALDLTGVDYIQFDILALDYDEDDYVITDNQKVVLEYSIDGGNNFIEIEKYPNTLDWNAAGLNTDNDYFLVKEMLPAAAQVKNAILRWRIEEYKKQFYIDNVLLRANYKLAPAVLNPVTEGIAAQRIEVDSVAYTMGNKGGFIELFYDIKGKFGVDNKLTVQFDNYETGDNGTLNLDLTVNKPLTFTGITSGKGSVIFEIGTLANFTYLHGEDVTFRLIAEDNTLTELDKYQDMDVEVNIYGDWSEYAADIDIFQAPDQPEIEGANDTVVCEGGSIVLTAPAGFTYYKWNTPEGTFDGISQTITADQSGSYTVQVANENFDVRCFSQASESVDLEVIELDEVYFSEEEIEVCRDATSVEITIEDTEPSVLYTLKDGLDVEHSSATGNGSDITFYVSNLSLIDGEQVFYVEATSERLSSCSKVVTPELLTVFETPVMGIKAFSSDDGYYEVTEENDVFCEMVDLGVGITDGTGISSAYNVIWYKNGIKYSTNYYINNAASGVYYAEYSIGNACTYTTNSVVVDDAPARQTITATGDLEFCEGEGELLLAVPAGFAEYTWMRYGSIIETSSNDNELHVGQSGDYTVQVSSEYGCSSQTSKTVEVEVFTKPSEPYAYQFGLDICESGFAKVEVNNVNPDVLYTIIDAETGNTLSNSVLSNGYNNLILETSETIDSSVTVYVIAERADINICNQESPTFEINVAKLTVKVIGNTLIAKVTGDNATSYQWFRNNKAMLNGGTSSTLTVYDDANYSLLVTTSNGCELEFSLGDNTPAETKGAVTLKSYPNPVETEMSLEFNNANGKVRIEIVDIMGQVKKVYEFVADKETEIHSINLDDFGPGLYTLRVSGDNLKQMKNFIKN